MTVTLSASEWGDLGSRYHLTPSDDGLPADRFIVSSELLDRDKCESYLDQLAAEIGSPSRRVTASMLAKRYAFLTVAPVLYAMTVMDKGLELAPSHCRLVSPSDSEYLQSHSRFPHLSLDGWNVTEPEAGKRAEWRDQVMRQLFEEHLTPLFHSLSIVGQVPRAVLWENAMVRIIPLYEDGLEDEEDPFILMRLHDDFKFITEKASPSLFGERRNPLKMFIRGKSTDQTGKQAAYKRKTCCFYDEMSPECCRACPKPVS
ncbi:ferric iron reductase protein FhuF [Paenibacillus endophyticus]|uniref:Ferric iron reductase protein FhuF n=1 Tax=Paenibacillus endophyticus TaxID=1294268 RepID=A0A7W5G9A8_9BACL|nr:IucA/IucC family C-terminal-domain containing protein [Paenibacillus endophyticus]MBB3151451.1 ferric iron reductase protein FhuF [Paenibacillus endophyticus]